MPQAAHKPAPQPKAERLAGAEHHRQPLAQHEASTMSYPAPEVDYRREIRRILHQEERAFFVFILGGVLVCAWILAALVLGQ